MSPERRYLVTPASQIVGGHPPAPQPALGAPELAGKQVERLPKLSNDQRKVLCELYERDLCANEIGDILGISRDHAHSFLGTLRRKGLVEVKGRKRLPTNVFVKVWRAV